MLHSEHSLGWLSATRYHEFPPLWVAQSSLPAAPPASHPSFTVMKSTGSAVGGSGSCLHVLPPSSVAYKSPKLKLELEAKRNVSHPWDRLRKKMDAVRAYC